MKTAICAVYDTTANLFGAPFSATNEQVAIRQFQAELTNVQATGPMQTHPQDFKLFGLGSFDNETGTYELYPQPLHLYQGTAA